MSADDSTGHETGDFVPLERGSGAPMLLVSDGTPADDVNRLVKRLEASGCDVGLEYAGEHQRAYVIDHDGFGGGRDGE